MGSKNDASIKKRMPLNGRDEKSLLPSSKNAPFAFAKGRL
jgi:hypothetical protein